MAASEGAAAAAGQWPIERLQPLDAQGLCPLSMEAGWNQVAADWQLMLTLGRGYGVRGADGRWIASALALPVAPDVCWLSMVLVARPMRGRGGRRRRSSLLPAAGGGGGGAAGVAAPRA